MDIQVTLIRSAPTEGGLEGKFLGLTDEPLSPEGERLLRERMGQKPYPDAQIYFSSHLQRCVRTAQIICPDVPIITLKELAAFDYGDFSGRAYSGIVRDERFDGWAQAGNLSAFPGGEGPHVFTSRCGKAFRHIIREAEKKDISSVCVVTHLSVIKAIIQRHCLPGSFYHDWHVDYCGGYTALYDPETGVMNDMMKI